MGRTTKSDKAMKKYALILSTTLLLFAGCTTDYLNPTTKNGEQGGETTITFKVSVPSSHPVPVTTRANIFPDSEIRTMDLLVFAQDGGGNPLIERRMADEVTLIANDGSTGYAEYTFTSLISRSGKPVRIYFVANGRNSGTNTDRVNFDDFPPGTNETIVMNYLFTNQLPSVNMVEGNICPLVMWGKSELLPEIGAEPRIDGIKLLRTVASVEVRATPAAGFEGTFSINRYSVGNASTSVSVAPIGWETWDGTTPAQSAAVANSYGLTDHFAHTTMSLTGGYWTNPNMSGLHYLNETNSKSSPPFVIVDAMYNGIRSFYKIELKAAPTAVPDGKFVRNRKYIVHIQKILGNGYPTPEAAKASLSNNNEIVAFVDTFDELTSFVFNAQDYLGVTASEMTIYSSGAFTSLFKAYTTHDFLTFKVESTIIKQQSRSQDAAGLITVWGSPVPNTTGTITVTSGTGRDRLTTTIHLTVKAP